MALNEEWFRFWPVYLEYIIYLRHTLQLEQIISRLDYNVLKDVISRDMPFVEWQMCGFTTVPLKLLFNQEKDDFKALNFLL